MDAALEFSCAMPYSSQGPPILADAEMRRRALELAASRGPQQVRFSERLLADPPWIRAWFRQFVEDCDEAFFAGPGPGCGTSSRRTPATRRTSCGAEAWPRRWPRCRPQ